ncbi:MAG: RdgB/HAM1 family non-canonical purine NTP pyrophosphatase [Candidatus Dadabacteria bacterium]|nr:MAG: RdgB/HAM1 family non-canonical purine NTP pyrophosphatase [Candidatus Dadabacteria bacterium]
MERKKSMYLEELIFATQNAGKLAEVKKTAEPYKIKILSPKEAAALKKITTAPPNPQETADSFAGNAEIKARAIYNWCRLPVIGDDSGLEVEALGGAPGLYSSRYAGPEQNAALNRKKLLKELKNETNRRARYVSFIYAVLSDDQFLTATDTLEGSIALEERGSGGFGYDSVFVVNGTGLTLAELKERGIPVKTHRIKALERLFKEISSSVQPA